MMKTLNQKIKFLVCALSFFVSGSVVAEAPAQNLTAELLDVQGGCNPCNPCKSHCPCPVVVTGPTGPKGDNGAGGPPGPAFNSALSVYTNGWTGGTDWKGATGATGASDYVVNSGDPVVFNDSPTGSIFLGVEALTPWAKGVYEIQDAGLYLVTYGVSVAPNKPVNEGDTGTLATFQLRLSSGNPAVEVDVPGSQMTVTDPYELQTISVLVNVKANSEIALVNITPESVSETVSLDAKGSVSAYLSMVRVK